MNLTSCFRSRAVHLLSRILTGTLLAACAIAKITFPAKSPVLLPTGVLLASAIVELGLVALLCTSKWRHGARLAILLALMGVVLTFWLDDRRNCGCAGRIVALTERSHLVLSSILGVLSTLALGSSNSESSSQTLDLSLRHAPINDPP